MPETDTAKKDDQSKYYRNGKMTRAGMVRVIEGGSSVLHNGIHYAKVADLPDEAELTEGDEAGAKVARDAIDAQISALASQRSALDATASRARDADEVKAREKAEADLKAAEEAAAKKAAAKHPEKK